MPRLTPSRHLPPALAVVAVGLFVASPALAGSDRVLAEGPIISYSSEVPAGASARVQAIYDAAGRSRITMVVRGLRPNTEYGAHAHRRPCGPIAADAGPHFQHAVDPSQPSTSPAYANSSNEIWLDFTSNADGRSTVKTTQRWQFEPDRRARSVVIHEEHTHTGGTDSGTAGARLGCLAVEF